MYQEIWKDIKGYEGYYQASNLGRVRSLDRTVKNKSFKGKILKPRYNSKGYTTTALSINGVQKNYLTHRLIALTFIPNPNDYREINHKNEIKDDNSADNLEWCDRVYNMNYGSIKETIRKNVSGVNNPHYGKHHSEETKEKLRVAHEKKIAQYTKDDELIKIWESATQAANALGLTSSAINSCLRNRAKTAGGFVWKYV